MRSVVILLMFVSMLSTIATSSATEPFKGPCAAMPRDTQTEISRLIALGVPDPEPGFNVQIHNSVEEFLANAPVLNPCSPKFHAGNAFFWQEYFMKSFMVSSAAASPDFRILGKILIGKDDMLVRSSGSMAQIQNELRALGPRNQFDHFVLDYIMLVLSDHTQYNEILQLFADSCERLSLTSGSTRAKSAATQMMKGAERLRLLAYKPKFSLRDTPRMLAIATVASEIGSTILSKASSEGPGSSGR